MLLWMLLVWIVCPSQSDSTLSIWSWWRATLGVGLGKLKIVASIPRRCCAFVICRMDTRVMRCSSARHTTCLTVISLMCSPYLFGKWNHQNLFASLSSPPFDQSGQSSVLGSTTCEHLAWQECSWVGRLRVPHHGQKATWEPHFGRYRRLISERKMMGRDEQSKSQTTMRESVTMSQEQQ